MREHVAGDHRASAGSSARRSIEENTVIHALEDALLAAYKKTPGAARHATVELDEEGEFHVFAIDIPADLEARLLDEAMEAKIASSGSRRRRGEAAHADQPGRARARLGPGARS